jgi:molecular chaperone GrpE
MNTKKEQKKAEEIEVVPRETYLRLAADFDNAKKEHAQMLEAMTKFATMPMVQQFLEVLDTLEDAIAHAPEPVRGETSWYAGIEQMHKQLVETLGRVGAERIETENQSFDPATMEAVSSVPGGEGNTVQAEQRAGWRMHGRVIRPARVVVFQ